MSQLLPSLASWAIATHASKPSLWNVIHQTQGQMFTWLLQIGSSWPWVYWPGASFRLLRHIWRRLRDCSFSAASEVNNSLKRPFKESLLSKVSFRYRRSDLLSHWAGHHWRSVCRRCPLPIPRSLLLYHRGRKVFIALLIRASASELIFVHQWVRIHHWIRHGHADGVVELGPSDHAHPLNRVRRDDRLLHVGSSQRPEWWIPQLDEHFLEEGYHLPL